MKVVVVSGKAGSGKTKTASELFWAARKEGREVTLYDEGKFVAQFIPNKADPKPVKISTALSDKALKVESWNA